AMIGGNGILVSELIQSAQRAIPNVSIHVFDTKGAPVFEPRGPAPAPNTLPAAVRATLADATRTAAGELIHRPVLNEPRCHECHDAKAALRGVLAIELDATRAEQHRDEILGVVLTDAFEQVMTAKKTELLDGYFAELKERVPSIRDVAVYDSSGSLTFGSSPSGPSEPWTAVLESAMKPGIKPHTVEIEGMKLRIVPMPLEKRCIACHEEAGGPVRGALVVSLAPLVAGGASAELEGVIDTSLRTIMMSALGRLVTRYLATVSDTKATRQLRLYDAEGRLYYDAIAVPTPPQAVAAALATQRGMVSHDGNNSLTVVVPLLNEPRCQTCHGDDQPVRGAIEIRASTDRAARARQEAVSNAVRFGILTVLIVFVLLWFALKRIVVDPVKRIGELADEIGQGNLTATEVRDAGPSGDEVARLGTRMNEMVRGLRAKLHLEKFVSKGTAEAARGAASGNIAFTREGVRTTCTVLFTDIRGFTAFSEHVEPEKVVGMLNRMLEAQAAVVEKFGGDIDKFVGDELMAVFHGDDGPSRAVQCAVEMIYAVEKARDGEEAIAVGAGIAYGDVVYGAIGSEQRMDFTVIGDVVNTGARLCSRAAASEVLVSAPVFENVGTLEDILFERVEPLLLKGKSEPLDTYRAASTRMSQQRGNS
ncbi:MAG: HAMP domain-containing protein, partial [Deltaproteobacteria bacterium]|nr:HAMP domain-containing protein [Deltaproteobacteria bacterium]